MSDEQQKSHRKRWIVVAILGITLVALLAYLYAAFLVNRSIRNYYHVGPEVRQF